MSRFFDEIEIFDSVAVRTGNSLPLAALRGRAGLCRSLTELGAKFRRLGDGCYYLAGGAWPGDATAINLSRTWQPLG